jgi:hypothetical protein
MSLLQAGFGSSGGEYTIDDSLRFRQSASAYLSRSQVSSVTNNKKYTISVWFKRGALGSSTGSTAQIIFQGMNQLAATGQIWSTLTFSSDTFYIGDYNGSSNAVVQSTAVYRDPAAWYHVVANFDSAQATASNRMKLYVNGSQVTTLTTANYPALNATSVSNFNNYLQRIGDFYQGQIYYGFDGYLAEYNFIDGQALTADDFGEFDANGTWKPLAYTGTYGNNGFYLPMTPTTQATGFNTVLFTGTETEQKIDGVGFSPDLVWLKRRSAANSHGLFDTVRGVNKYVRTEVTAAEGTAADLVNSFDPDGFTLGSNGTWNNSGSTNVAWCWDAGSGSAGTNTDGDINSTVKANPATGFSIVSYTGTGSGGTVGHGLGVAPAMIIIKKRSATGNWVVYHQSLGIGKYVYINSTAASATYSGFWNDVAPTSSVFNLGGGNSDVNGSAATYIAYCFAEVAGYSKFDSYTGTGASGKVVTTGFRPAFVMIKRTDSANSWVMIDAIRDPVDIRDSILWADLADAEASGGTTTSLDFTDTGFELNGGGGSINVNGGTYIYMAFADTADARFNFDASGNHNNWEANNINSNAESETTYDLMKDTPSLVDTNAGNFATLNPLDKYSSAVIAEGNLKIGANNNSWTNQARSTFFVSSGKWYWEVTFSPGTGSFWKAGIRDAAAALTSNNSSSTGYEYYAYNGNKQATGVNSSYGSGLTAGDVLGLALDMDAGTITAYKNNTSLGVMFSGLSGSYSPTVSMYNSFISLNFGQRPFAYTPPSGFLKLNTFNLPDSTIEKGAEYMTTTLWAGNGATSRAISNEVNGISMQPDVVWLKSRSTANQHVLLDSVRGTNKYLRSSSTAAEGTFSFLSSFNSDGFTLSTNDNEANANGYNYVGWQWKASNTTATNSAGANGATIASTYSANTTSGFSIVTYTGTAANATVFHGIGTAPSIIICKSRTSVISWPVYSSTLGISKYLELNTTIAAGSISNYWGANSPTSTVFSLPNAAYNNNLNSQNYIAYCFAEVPGYSAFGIYTGNASTDGPFIFTGMRPSWLLVKRTDAAGNAWYLEDSSRNTYNPVNLELYPNLANAEATSTDYDFLSNGFKIRASHTGINANGGTYIYMAFAENPFKNSNAR